MTIYMKFANKKTNLLNNKTTGEAPQLSTTYAEYDDGANVFNFYGDFRGTVLNANKWDTAGSSTNIATYIHVDNLLTVSPPGPGEGVSVYSLENFAAPNIIEWYGSFTGPSPTANQQPSGFNNVAIGGFQTNFCGLSNTFTFGLFLVTGCSASTVTLVQMVYTSAKSLYSVDWTTSSVTAKINYSNSVTATSNIQTSPLDISFGAGGAGYSANVYWVRVRAYPPNEISNGEV